MTLPEVIEFIKTHTAIWYHAPMDHKPACVRVIRYTVWNYKPEKSTVTLQGAELTFTANIQQHLDRFSSNGGAA